MNKYVFLFPSMPMSGPPSPEVHAAWGAWFGSIGEQLVDGGNPFGGGVRVTSEGTEQLTPEMHPAGGYTIVNAADLEGAIALLDGCPIPSGVRIHEALPM